MSTTDEGALPEDYKLELSIDEKRELAEVIVKVLVGAGYGAKPHANCPGRVYVSRKLSKRVQDMGYVELLRDGQRNYNGLERAAKTVRDLIELDAVFLALLEKMKRADEARARRGVS